jgi:hypothetical protein
MCSEYEQTLFNAKDKFSIKQVKETLKTACYWVYNGNVDKLGELQVALDLFILANDLGDEVYKQKCEAILKIGGAK